MTPANKSGITLMIHITTPITVHLRYTGSNFSLLFSTIPATPYCKEINSSSRYLYFSDFIPLVINTQTAPAMINKSMITPIPPAASSDNPIVPYSDKPPSNIKVIGEIIQASTAAAIFTDCSFIRSIYPFYFKLL